MSSSVAPADTALKLLDKPTEKERKLLGAWRYSDGTITLHKDHSSFSGERNDDRFHVLIQKKARPL